MNEEKEKEDPVCLHDRANMAYGCQECGAVWSEVRDDWEVWGADEGYAPPYWEPSS